MHGCFKTLRLCSEDALTAHRISSESASRACGRAARTEAHYVLNFVRDSPEISNHMLLMAICSAIGVPCSVSRCNAHVSARARTRALAPVRLHS
eukprot:6185580-Pleurochrysis_carterae.AAC.6